MVDIVLRLSANNHRVFRFLVEHKQHTYSEVPAKPLIRVADCFRCSEVIEKISCRDQHNACRYCKEWFCRKCESHVIHGCKKVCAFCQSKMRIRGHQLCDKCYQDLKTIGKQRIVVSVLWDLVLDYTFC